MTSFQHTAVVTEVGRADLMGFCQQDQAAHLIERAARPEARDQLRAQAAALGLGLRVRYDAAVRSDQPTFGSTEAGPKPLSRAGLSSDLGTGA